MKATIGTLAILIQIATSFRAPSTYVTSRSQCQNNNPSLWNKCDISVFDRYTPCNLYHEEFRRTRALSLSQQIDQSNAQAPTAGNKKGSVGRSKKSQPNSRTVAINALAQDSASFASRQLEQDENYTMLEARDRSFARLLVATVERRLGQIDKILGLVIAKYPPKKGKHAHLIQATLRTGVAQLLFLRTPPHAAIKETVQVLRIYHHVTSSNKNPPVPEAMIKFVNGVLRKLSRPASSPGEEDVETPQELEGFKLLREKTTPEDNIAPWLIQKWKQDWGEDCTRLICENMMPSDESLVVPRIDLSTKYTYSDDNSQEAKNEQLQQLIGDLGEDAVLLPHGSIRVGSSLKGGVQNWPGYDEGVWWVQDASSTLPAMVLISALRDKFVGHVGDSSSGSSSQLDGRENLSEINVIDMCAAPGGKTAQLLSAGFGRVTAVEANPRRSRRLIENLERLQMSEKCDVVVQEGQNWIPSGKVDSDYEVVHGILLDVPCSATGTGARRPDVLRRDADLNSLLQTQETLANHCADNILSVGGIMAFATCSILKEESEDQVEKLIAKGDAEKGSAVMRTLPIEPCEVPGYESAINEKGWLRVLPGVLDGELKSTDGFFVARLVRVA